MNKYHAVRTFSNLVGIWFASKGECVRGEELRLRQLAGEITNLHYHVKFVLSKRPKVSIEVDFVYREDGRVVHEDFKGRLTEAYRIKMAWLKDQQGIDIILTREVI